MNDVFELNVNKMKVMKFIFITFIFFFFFYNEPIERNEGEL